MSGEGAAAAVVEMVIVAPTATPRRLTVVGGGHAFARMLDAYVGTDPRVAFYVRHSPTCGALMSTVEYVVKVVTRHDTLSVDIRAVDEFTQSSYAFSLHVAAVLAALGPHPATHMSLSIVGGQSVGQLSLSTCPSEILRQIGSIVGAGRIAIIYAVDGYVRGGQALVEALWERRHTRPYTVAWYGCQFDDLCGMSVADFAPLVAQLVAREQPPPVPVAHKSTCAAEEAPAPMTSKSRDATLYVSGVGCAGFDVNLADLPDWLAREVDAKAVGCVWMWHTSHTHTTVADAVKALREAATPLIAVRTMTIAPDSSFKVADLIAALRADHAPVERSSTHTHTSPPPKASKSPDATLFVSGTRGWQRYVNLADLPEWLAREVDAQAVGWVWIPGRAYSTVADAVKVLRGVATPLISMCVPPTLSVPDHMFKVADLIAALRADHVPATHMVIPVTYPADTPDHLRPPPTMTFPTWESLVHALITLHLPLRMPTHLANLSIPTEATIPLTLHLTPDPQPTGGALKLEARAIIERAHVERKPASKPV